MHQTDCEPVLDKMGIDYDPDGKYELDGKTKKINSRAYLSI
jgi:hypothetical protein